MLGCQLLGQLATVLNIFHMNNLSHCRVMDFILFGNGLITFSRQNYLSEAMIVLVIVDVETVRVLTDCMLGRGLYLLIMTMNVMLIWGF